MIGKQSRLDYHYNALAWSPSNDEELILGLRPDPDNVSTGLWLVHPTYLEGRMFAQEEDHSYYGPRWDPWGRAVIFQQIQLGAAYQPEIAFWESGMEDPVVLAEGFSPHWMP